jgi:hypothetical protein
MSFWKRKGGETYQVVVKEVFSKFKGRSEVLDPADDLVETIVCTYGTVMPDLMSEQMSIS